MVLLRRVSAAVAALCIFVTAIGTAHAAGSFAVGACGAFGYGYDYRKLTAARAHYEAVGLGASYADKFVR